MTKHRLVPVGTPREQREKLLRSHARHFGYKMTRGPAAPELDCPTGDPSVDLKAGLDLIGKSDEHGYMLFDNRTGFNVLGGASGKDGLGATSSLEAWSSSLDDIEEFLGEIREQVERHWRGKGR